MPQMAPMNWEFLYMYFSMLLLIMVMLNFYSFMYKPMNLIKFFNKNNKINWKW